MKNRMIKFVLGTITGVMMFGMTAFAAEDFTVADTSAVLYTVEGADLLVDADSNAQVAVPDLQAGLPLQVTGITSNGYFRIVIADQTYYVEGTGLVQGTGSVVSAGETAAAATTSGIVPVKDANGNYICLIEDRDIDIFEDITAEDATWNEFFNVRQDYTQNPIYIVMRDAIESKIVAGEEFTHGDWTGVSFEKQAELIAINVLIDVNKSHPEYQQASFGVYGFTGNYGMNNPFNGQSEATYYASINRNELSRKEMNAILDASLLTAEEDGWIVRRPNR